MSRKFSAREVRALVRRMERETPASRSGQTGACVVTRFRRGTKELCFDIDQANCTKIGHTLEDAGDGFSVFHPGRSCD